MVHLGMKHVGNTSCERAVGTRLGREEQSRNAVARRETPAAVLQCIEGVWEGL